MCRTDRGHMREPEVVSSESRGQWHRPGPQPWSSFAMSFALCFLLFFCLWVYSWPLPLVGDYRGSDFHGQPVPWWFPTHVGTSFGSCRSVCSTACWTLPRGWSANTLKVISSPFVSSKSIPSPDSLRKILSSEAKITSKWFPWCFLSLKTNRFPARRRQPEGDRGVERCLLSVRRCVWDRGIGSCFQETEMVPWKLQRWVKQSTANSKSFQYLCSV